MSALVPILILDAAALACDGRGLNVRREPNLILFGGENFFVGVTFRKGIPCRILASDSRDGTCKQQDMRPDDFAWDRVLKMAEDCVAEVGQPLAGQENPS